MKIPDLQIEIDGDALQRRIDEMAQISEAPEPVVTRVLFSEADLKARNYIRNLARQEGLTVREDAVGNLFARWGGLEPALPPVASGSHTDAVPNAGRYDGVVGTLGALEAISALRRSGFRPRHSIEAIMFASEEPTRFGLGCVGSRLLAGSLSAQAARALVDANGRSMEDWRKIAGFQGPLESVRIPKGGYAAFVELHIEQGPELEREGVPIGIVERIAGPSSYRVRIEGEGGHAGGRLMPGRRDALLAGAEIALAVEQAALTSGSEDTVGTTGVFKIEPGAVNSIPFRAYLEIDLRDTRLETRNRALNEIRRALDSIAAKRKIQAEFIEINADSPADGDASTIQIIENSCQAIGIPCRRIVAHAYHDTLFMASICPATMIFIPCRNGWSHRPEEYASPEAIKTGCAVLARTLAALASGS